MGNSTDMVVSGESDNVLQRLWLRRRLFVTVFCTVLALTVVALVVLPVRYIATASVIVAEQETNMSNANAASAWAQKIGDPADLESQMQVVRSAAVMRQAMAAPGVAEAVTKECQRQFRLSLSNTDPCEKVTSDVTAFIEYVENGYVFSAVGRSRVISISYQSSFPDVAQTMANALTNAYLDSQRSAGTKDREAAVASLHQQLAQLDTQMREADAKIQEFRQSKGLMRGATAPISSERLTNVSQQYSAAEAARALAASRLQEIKQAHGSTDASAVLSSRVVENLKQQLAVTSAQLASSANILGPKHPTLIALQQEQATIQQRLADEEASIAANAQKAYDASDAVVASLRKQMDAVKNEAGSAASDESSIDKLVRNNEVKRLEYAEISKRASELETDRRVLTGSTKLVSLAELPGKPFFPKKVPFLAAGSTIALILAIITCLTFDQLHLAQFRPVGGTPRRELARSNASNPYEWDPRPVARPAMNFVPSSVFSTVIGAPLLARLPRLNTSLSPIATIINGKSGIPLTQALEIARYDPRILSASDPLVAGLLTATACKAILVSSNRSDGKTFVTLMLARRLAMMGRRVLVVETDLQHPSFRTALGLRSMTGLQNVLAGESGPRDVVNRTDDANLDVIVAGSGTARAGDLFGSGRFSRLLKWARSYDVVLFDGPCAASLSAARLPLGKLDGVLLCIEDGTSIGEAVAASSVIKASGGQVIGLALTFCAEHRAPRMSGMMADHQAWAI